MFHDITLAPSQHHCWFKNLEMKIPYSERRRVYGMHLPSKDSIPFLKKEGFSIVEVNPNKY